MSPLPASLLCLYIVMTRKTMSENKVYAKNERKKVVFMVETLPQPHLYISTLVLYGLNRQPHLLPLIFGTVVFYICTHVTAFIQSVQKYINIRCTQIS